MNRSLIWLAEIHHVFVYSAEMIAILSNTILIYLILTERKQLYNDYKRALILNCIIDYLCSFISIIIQPHFEIIDGYWIFILSWPLTHFTKNVQILLVGLYSFSNCFGITTIPISFLFRQKLICTNQKMSIMKLLKLTSIRFIVASSSSLLFSYSFYVSQGREFSSQLLIDAGIITSNELKNLLNAEMNTISMITLTLFICVMSNLVFVSVIYLSYKTYTKLNSMSAEMHPKTKKMQKHFNWMLFTQVASTFAFGNIPAIFLLFLMATRINVLGAGTTISIFFAFVPVINPICSLVLVGHFRRRFLTILHIIQPTNSNDHRG